MYAGQFRVTRTQHENNPIFSGQFWVNPKSTRTRNILTRIRILRVEFVSGYQVVSEIANPILARPMIAGGKGLGQSDNVTLGMIKPAFLLDNRPLSLSLARALIYN